MERSPLLCRICFSRLNFGFFCRDTLKLWFAQSILVTPHLSLCQLPAADTRYTHTAILIRLAFLGDLPSHWSLHFYSVSSNLLCLILSISLSSLPLFLCLSHVPGLLNMMTGEHELSVRHSAAAPPCFWQE
jgi:hypothetical protein